MALPAAYLGLKAVQNPDRVGGIVAIVVSVILLIVGGTLLAVGVGKTPNDSSLVTGGAVTLAIGVLIGAVGLYFTLRKKSTPTSSLGSGPTTPQVGSAFDETENQPADLTASSDDGSFGKQPALSTLLPAAASVPGLSVALPAQIEDTVSKLTTVYKQNPLIKAAIDAAVARVDKTGQLSQLLQQGASAATSIQKVISENPALASTLTALVK